MKLVFLLFVWLESFVFCIPRNPEILLITNEPSSSDLPYYASQEPLLAYLEDYGARKRSFRNWLSPSTYKTINRSSRKKKKHVSYPFTSAIGLESPVGVRMKRNVLESLDLTDLGRDFYSIEQLPDTYYLSMNSQTPQLVAALGSVQSEKSSKTDKITTNQYLYDDNFAGFPFNEQLNRGKIHESLTPIVMLNEFSPVSHNGNSEFEGMRRQSSSIYPNYLISKSDQPTNAGASLGYNPKGVQQRLHRYLYMIPYRDLITLKATNSDIHFPQVDHEPQYQLSSPAESGQTPSASTPNFDRTNLASVPFSKNEPYFLGSSDGSTATVPSYFANQVQSVSNELQALDPQIMDQVNEADIASANQSENIRNPLKSLKIPRNIEMTNLQIQKNSNTYQSREDQVAPETVLYLGQFTSLEEETTPTLHEQERPQLSREKKIHYRNRNVERNHHYPNEKQTLTQTDGEQTTLNHPVETGKFPQSNEAVETHHTIDEKKINQPFEAKNISTFNSFLQDQISSNSKKNLNVDSKMEFRKLNGLNSTLNEASNNRPAWIIVVQKRNENKFHFYHKILSLLDSINRKLKTGNYTTANSSNDFHFTRKPSTTSTVTSSTTQKVVKNMEIDPYSVALREFILNQIFLLSESLETLKEIEGKGMDPKNISISKPTAHKNVTDKSSQNKSKLNEEIGKEASKVEQKLANRKKRYTKNLAHFEAVDNMLSFQLLEQALKGENDESLLNLLEDLLSETKRHLLSVSNRYDVPILKLPSQIPNSVADLDAEHVLKLQKRKRLLKKIHLFNQLKLLTNNKESQSEFDSHDKFSSFQNNKINNYFLEPRTLRQKRFSNHDGATSMREKSGEMMKKTKLVPTFTLPFIELKDSQMESKDSLTEPRTTTPGSSQSRNSRIDNSTLINPNKPKLRTLNLAYGTPKNRENVLSEEKLEKRMLTMEKDDPFSNDWPRGSVSDLPELLKNSFVTQNRTQAEIVFRKRMLKLPTTSERRTGNMTDPLNVLYADTDILISSLPHQFLADKLTNNTVEDLKLLLNNNGSVVSQVYIVKENGCQFLKIMQDKYFEESCGFNVEEKLGLNDSMFLNPEVKQNRINSGLTDQGLVQGNQVLDPTHEPVINFRSPQISQLDFNNREAYLNAGLNDQFYDQYSSNTEPTNSELLDLYSRMPELSLDDSQILDQQMLNAGMSEEDIMNAYYFNSKNFNNMGATIIPDASPESVGTHSGNSEVNPTTVSNKIKKSWASNLKEMTESSPHETWLSSPKEQSYQIPHEPSYFRSPIKMGNLPIRGNDDLNESPSLDSSNLIINDTELDMASSTLSQRAGRKVDAINANVLPNDLVNILKALANNDNSLTLKDKDLANSLHAGIDILSNVESLLGRLQQGQVTVNTGTTINPFSSRSEQSTTLDTSESEFLRNVSTNPLFNGIRVDSEKQINIELTLDNNEKVLEEATTTKPVIKIQPSDLEKLLNFRNNNSQKPPKSKDEKLYVLPASFLKNLEGFDYSEFESTVSYNFSKNNNSKPATNATDEIFLKNLLENKEKLINLLTKLDKEKNDSSDDNFDSEDISHLKNLIKTKSEPVIDSIISGFFQPFINSKQRTSKSTTKANVTKISDVTRNSSHSPENLEIFILRYDGGGQGVQTLLKEYKDFTENLLETKGRKLAAQIDNDTAVTVLNETTPQETTNLTGIQDKIFVGTTKLNNGTNIKVTIAINSDEEKGNSTDENYYKEILLFGNDTPGKSKTPSFDDAGHAGKYAGKYAGRTDPTGTYSSQNDFYNPILAANKPQNLKSNQNFGFIRLPRKTVHTTEENSKLRNSDFSVSLTNRKFSSRMQRISPTEDYISQLMPPLPEGKLIPHYQFPIILPLESTATAKPKWVWMKTDDATTSGTEQRTTETSIEAPLKSKATSEADEETPSRNFFGELATLEDAEKVFKLEESSTDNDLSWLW